MADSTLHSRYHSRKEEGEMILFSHGFVLFVFVPRNNKLEDIRLVAELDVATRTWSTLAHLFSIDGDVWISASATSAMFIAFAQITDA